MNRNLLALALLAILACAPCNVLQAISTHPYLPEPGQPWVDAEPLGWVYTPHYQWLYAHEDATYYFAFPIPNPLDEGIAFWFWASTTGWFWHDGDVANPYVWTSFLRDPQFLPFPWVRAIIAQCAIPLSWPQFDSLPESDPFDLLDARLLDYAQLEVTVAFSGGCADHTFALFVSKEVSPLAVFPPLVEGRLIHDDEGDLCEAYPTETRTFDLRKAAAIWRENGHQIVTIVLANGNEPAIWVDVPLSE